ncbi:MAG: aminotransferase class V-fold PLP-dependent enzyme [Haliscomenobacteraceae bacterium CHB4]|nr:aminotransferase class V-fold PLP-dependent enzyme [Haliscomenobacteraceae bacterium CHB4]
MTPSIESLRADTPAFVNTTADQPSLIHLNNAGAALPPMPVLRAMQEHLDLEARMGGYEAADVKATEIAGFYPAIARLLNAQPRNIAFAASATDAYARALSAIPFRPGDAILTTENDYISNQIAFLALQKRFGIRLIRARDTAEGGVDVTDFEQLLKKYRPVLAAVTHVPTNSGLVQPVEAIGNICRAHGVWYLVDACQSAGQMALDVQRIGCDFLSATMRKFLRGPRGAGFLYASDRALDGGLEMLLPDMRSADWTGPDEYVTAPGAHRFEYWEMSPALVLGSKAAAEYALAVGMDWIEQRVKMLANLTRQRLRELPGVQVLDKGTELCGIITAFAPQWDPKQLLEKLRAENINCRLSSLAVAQIDFPRKGVTWALRVSPHYYNTEEEVERMAEVIRRSFIIS